MNNFYSIFWGRSCTTEALKQKETAQDGIAFTMKKDYGPKVKDEPKVNDLKNKSLRETIKNHPDSQKANEICQHREQFEKISPSWWIMSAKSHPTLYKKILLNPELAGWVNQFPEGDPSGLLLIATYSKELAAIAQEYGQGVISKEHSDVIGSFYQQHLLPYKGLKK